MGLFDKLKEAVNTVVDTVKETAQGINDSNQGVPPLDEETKKYYEIIYWMRTNQRWYGKESTDENSRARKYIEFMLGEPCNEESFKKAVELTNLGHNYYPSNTKDKLGIELNALDNKLNNELAEVNNKLRQGLYEEAESLYKYNCDSEKAYRVCYSQLIEEIKALYNGILNVIKDNVECEHFIEGFNKRILEKFQKEYEHIDMCMYIVISDSFFEENPITKKLLFKFFIDVLYNRVNNDLPNEYVSNADLIYSLALRAIHFENCTQSEYTPIEYEECKNFVLSRPKYVEEIKNHPFEKEEYITKFTNKVRTAYSFELAFSSFEEYDDFISSYNHSALTWAKHRTTYFDDALANFAWKEIAKEYIETTDEKGEIIIGESKDPIIVAKMIYDYIKED